MYNMAAKRKLVAVFTVVVISILSTTVISDDNAVVPAEKAKLNDWFKTNVKPFKDRRDTLDPAIVKAEAQPKVMKVRKDGSGEFKTVSEAVNKIPVGNTQRVIISIGPGTYQEKVIIDKKKPFVTLMGSDPNNLPTIVFGDTAATNGKGTMESATVIADSDHFYAVNLNIKNSAPRPEVGAKDKQAVALRLAGDMAAIYNVNFFGFQDTLCDFKGRHFFKGCYVEGTCDFVFGDAKSLYLDTELYVIPGDNVAMITANGKKDDQSDTGYSFVQCNVSSTGSHAVLGRAWYPYSHVIFAYSDISDVVKPEGWSENLDPANEKTVTYGEYKNRGPGADTSGRVKFTKILSDADAKPYLSLSYIEASKWLLPPPSADGSAAAETAPTTAATKPNLPGAKPATPDQDTPAAKPTTPAAKPATPAAKSATPVPKSKIQI